MNSRLAPSEADLRFFRLLCAADTGALAGLLAEEFLLIDVSTGAEITREALLGELAAGRLVFETIEPLEQRLRGFGSSAVITGRTRIQGRYLETPFSAHSRYTHVFVQQDAGWRLASAQGTPISGPGA